MKKKKKTVKPTGRFKEFLRSAQFAKLRGACYILFAIFLAISLVSLYFCGRESNWMGNFGRGLSVFFAEKFFGVGSLGIAFLFFLYGLKLWKVNLLPWWRSFGAAMFWMLWISLLLGYVGARWVQPEDDSFDAYAGMGLMLSAMLIDAMRWWTLVMLLFVAIVFLVFVHHVRMKMPKLPKIDLDLKRKPSEVQPANPQIDSLTSQQLDKEELPATIEFDVNDDVALEPNEKKRKGLFSKPEPNLDATTQQSNTTSEADIDDEFERLTRKYQGATEDLQPLETNSTDQQINNSANQTSDPSFTINLSPEEDSANIGGSSSEEEPPQVEAEQLVDDQDYSRHFGINDLYDPHLDLRDFQMPSTDMLQDWEVKNAKVTRDELVANKDRIVSTLRDYGIEIVEISATPGPTVTLYEIKPAPGVRIAKIKSLEDDIALSLSALGIRIIAPIPGKGTVGIEVPNAKPQIVSMKTMLASDAFQNSGKMELPIAIGKTISNEPFVTDLAKMPHLLMAGATGTGKSVGLNAVISSLLYKKHPSELKFVMVDPKKVELSLYSKIERHYLAKLPDSEEAIITDVKKVVRTLNSLCIEMDQRYDLLKQAQVRKITEYNDKFIHRRLNPDNGHRYLPYIVLVVDEFADLIMTAGKEVEGPICRLAQLARAVGIHLIIATQRPTTNIITGTIKANFPARIAFKVTSGVDSRTILDAGGAQRLIGRGDMLISLSGSDMVRLQCALIETEEIDKLADFIGQQRGYPEGFLLPEYLDENEEPNKDFDPKQKDEFFNDAARLVVASQFGSTSLLQRKLSLGYNRAGRIIDQLEAAGIVGPYNGSKPRDVLIHDENELEERLREL
ncbi:MAG: DNA translocase FtsK [Bacteroidales bacterium]|nr:DNA translocase FtsK [Candidatus Colimorpha pelethequi]